MNILRNLTTGADGGGQFGEHGVGGGPVYAAVGDALAVYEFVEGRAGFQLLCAGDEIAFDHDAEDVAVA